MKTAIRKKGLLAGVLALVILASCATVTRVPITGRKQRLSVTNEQMLSLSTTQYKEYLGSAKKSTNATNTALVQRVGKKLADAVISYLMNNGYANEANYYAWEFNLVQNTSVNAFCMPGGKIVVYEGMLAVTQDEPSLAIVLGHEIAHAVAKHSAEQLSKQKNQSIITSLGSSILAAKVGEETANMATSLASTGLTFLNAHYSRDNESEADHMGLIFAAMAGYDPNTAITFWQRMSKASGGKQAGVLQSYLSSHPSDAKRISDIQRWLPEAMKYYTGTK
ncbi:MAG: M48 family metallopeptidase [Bacteroidaceae bacterium]|nr:M48 family metallopeptidase [Bacteroidaceae bacterium]MBQ2518992.1 M48 family metallopeptidase [Bacteroidaceae bacterium]MBQ3957442.1 M48 family metallopeptidase [Bacteroidaceae bacterium]MBQ3992532.1 M48 family metallopeptidase [Bacteroidaceae bacterium]MBQ4003024.1 M48 family metallopeptidase [Bacteroidaceae bacterium]